MRLTKIAAVAVIGALALVLAPPALPNDDPEGALLEGTWLTVVYFDGAPLIQMLQNFTKDGRTTLLLPFGTGINSDDTRVGCMGEWKRARGRTFDVTDYCLFHQLPGVQPDVIRLKLTLDKRGDHFSGPFTYFYADPDYWGPYEQSGLTLVGTRLGLQPLAQ